MALMILNGRNTARMVFQRIERVRERPKYKGRIINKLAKQATRTIVIEPATKPEIRPLLLWTFLKIYEAGTTKATPTIRLASSPIPAVRVIIRTLRRFLMS